MEARRETAAWTWDLGEKAPGAGETGPNSSRHTCGQARDRALAVSPPHSSSSQTVKSAPPTAERQAAPDSAASPTARRGRAGKGTCLLVLRHTSVFRTLMEKAYHGKQNSAQISRTLCSKINQAFHAIFHELFEDPGAPPCVSLTPYSGPSKAGLLPCCIPAAAGRGDGAPALGSWGRGEMPTTTALASQPPDPRGREQALTPVSPVGSAIRGW